MNDGVVHHNKYYCCHQAIIKRFVAVERQARDLGLTNQSTLVMGHQYDVNLHS